MTRRYTEVASKLAAISRDYHERNVLFPILIKVCKDVSLWKYKLKLWLGLGMNFLLESDRVPSPRRGYKHSV